MSDSKWTPGPYTVHPYNERMGSLISYGDICKGENVAIVLAQRDHAQGRANARLIAAAPALYAALEANRLWFEHNGFTMPPCYGMTVAALLLARPEGGKTNG